MCGYIITYMVVDIRGHMCVCSRKGGGVEVCSKMYLIVQIPIKRN